MANDLLDLGNIPKHVAIVMDGNGRWAKQRNLPRTEGHSAGERAILDVIDGALEIGLPWLSLYAFSTENWRRPADEVRYLMYFNENLLLKNRDDLNQKGVRIRFSGRRDWRIPKRLERHMDDAIQMTKDNKKLTLTICFNYGGRAEIIDAIKKIAAEQIPPSKINERTLKTRLYYPDMPDPDLVIRTSGEYRISNFLLWELAYSELVFSDMLWPDFRREHLFKAIEEFQQRNRRFGRVGQ
jgi:undecaprenyl diphosphate synthase